MSGRRPPSSIRRRTARLDGSFPLQRPDGWWVGELESNVTMTAHLLLLEFLGLRDEETTRRCNELLARQRPDGLWAIHRGAEPDLAATRVLCGFADRRVFLDADDERLARALLLRGAAAFWAARVSHPHSVLRLRLWPWTRSRSSPELILLRPFFVLGVRLRVLATLDQCQAHGRPALPPVRNLPPERACHDFELARPRARRRWAWRATGRWPGTRRGRPSPAGSGRRTWRSADHRPAGARRLLGGIQPCGCGR